MTDEQRSQKKDSIKPEHVEVSRRKAIAAFSASSLALIGLPMQSLAESADDKKSLTRFYDSVSAMKADRAVDAGETVVTLGYYRPGDGGGAIYNVIESKKHLNPDEGSVITLHKKKYALLSDVPYVNYTMFGARSDGHYNDGDAIKAAHSFANNHEIPVINLNGEYWIKETYNIAILTNVYWGHSIFHIDEYFNSQKSYRFRVKSRLDPYSIDLNESSKKKVLEETKPGVQIIPELARHKNSLIFITDKNDRIGYRAGSKYKGQAHSKEDFVYVEEGGRLVGEIAWTFSNYTSLTAYPCDDSYLTIDGGTFHLSGNNPGEEYNGYWRNGFSITRSRTIIRNQWVGLDEGKSDISLTPRSGFYSFSRVFDTVLENVRLTPWIQDRAGEDKDVQAGTYGISCNRTLQTRFCNVTAEGGKGYWGVFGTNLNKRFFIDRCNLNRVDVHFHCWNLHIMNSHIGYRGITVTGGGELTIENTTVWSRRYFVSFRRDFGSRWDGNIYINNCRYIPAEAGDNVILNFSPADFNYHYSIGFGHSIEVNNLTVDYSSSSDPEAVCWLMRVASFSKMKDGQRLFFPSNLAFENIKVEGREKGLRLLNIEMPQFYKLPLSGGYDGDELHTNSKLMFSNVQLEKINPQRSKSTPEVHLLINKDPAERYLDANALYPDICIKRCGDLCALVSGAANLQIDHCNVQWLSTSVEGYPLQGALNLQNCSIKPTIKEIDQQAFYLTTKSGTNFINCLFLSPELNGISHPELIDKFDIIEINKRVRYNHLNSRLGNGIRLYFKDKGIHLSARFIDMLKAHSDLENEF